MPNPVASFRRHVVQPIADYFRGRPGRPLAAQERAWTKLALPRLKRQARALADLERRGDYASALLLLGDAARLLSHSGYPPSAEDEPLFALEAASLDTLATAEAEARYSAIEPIFGQILEAARATPRQLARRRIATVSLAAAALLIAAVVSSRSRQNLALHKPVKASSTAFDTRAEGAVDGFRHGQLGFHSKEEREPWLVIDLGAPYTLERVRAFGRADCCFDQSIPLRLETSLDGSSYERVAERKQPFSQFDPWQADLNPTPRARYVRLKTGKRSFLVLSEVEVFGR